MLVRTTHFTAAMKDTLALQYLVQESMTDSVVRPSSNQGGK